MDLPILMDVVSRTRPVSPAPVLQFPYRNELRSSPVFSPERDLRTAKQSISALALALPSELQETVYPLCQCLSLPMINNFHTAVKIFCNSARDL
jgi:hypothetical protein